MLFLFANKIIPDLSTFKRYLPMCIFTLLQKSIWFNILEVTTNSTTQVLLALAYWWLWKINGSARSESSRCEEIGIEKKKPTWADLYTLELQSKTIQPCLLLIVSTDKFHSASYSLQSGTSHAKMALGLILGNIKEQGTLFTI